jgi:hypothetical protein
LDEGKSTREKLARGNGNLEGGLRTETPFMTMNCESADGERCIVCSFLRGGRRRAGGTCAEGGLSYAEVGVELRKNNCGAGEDGAHVPGRDRQDEAAVQHHARHLKLPAYEREREVSAGGGARTNRPLSPRSP